jgi:hypothetical protein
MKDYNIFNQLSKFNYRQNIFISEIELLNLSSTQGKLNYENFIKIEELSF